MCIYIYVYIYMYIYIYIYYMYICIFIYANQYNIVDPHEKDAALQNLDLLGRCPDLAANRADVEPTWSASEASRLEDFEAKFEWGKWWFNGGLMGFNQRNGDFNGYTLW